RLILRSNLNNCNGTRLVVRVKGGSDGFLLAAGGHGKFFGWGAFFSSLPSPHASCVGMGSGENEGLGEGEADVLRILPGRGYCGRMPRAGKLKASASRCRNPFLSLRQPRAFPWLNTLRRRVRNAANSCASARRTSAEKSPAAAASTSSGSRTRTLRLLLHLLPSQPLLPLPTRWKCGSAVWSRCRRNS